MKTIDFHQRLSFSLASLIIHKIGDYSNPTWKSNLMALSRDNWGETNPTSNSYGPLLVTALCALDAGYFSTQNWLTESLDALSTFWGKVLENPQTSQ